MTTTAMKQSPLQHRLLISSGILGASAALSWLFLYSNPIGWIILGSVTGVILLIFPGISWIAMMGVMWVLPTCVISGIIFWKIYREKRSAIR